MVRSILYRARSRIPNCRRAQLNINSYSYLTTSYLNGLHILRGQTKSDYIADASINISTTTGIRGFAECLLSGTRQRKLCRVPHSVTLGTRQRQLCRALNTRHRTALGKDNFAECQTLGKVGSRQTAVSGRPKADGR
jgi:hypothetical protein